MTRARSGLFLVEALRDGVDERDELVRRLVAEYDTTVPEARADVDEFVDALMRQLMNGANSGA